MPVVTKMWHLLPHDPQRSESLARTLKISPVLAQLLLNRGIEQPDAARRFLGASLRSLHPPALLPGINEAVDRILKAVRDGRRICVYGDYDVDGTTGIAILLLTLRSLGAANCDFYVPHRLTEGYGVNIEALKQLRESGAELVITVDCGINSLDEAAEARQLGLEFIVTDHHQCGACLPQADSVVHPSVPGTSYPFRDLSGSGVALKLAWALCQRAAGGDRVSEPHRELLQDCVALAALGTVADVVPLFDENRILVRFGLNRLVSAPCTGIKALLSATGLNGKTSLKATDIGFKLGPRLNAVGRIGWAKNVVDLLTTTSPQHATELAGQLEQANEERQRIERRILAEAKELAEREAYGAALVLASHEWHAGVIGIVAGRLVEHYARPVLLISLNQDASGTHYLGQGSGRSVPGFPLHEALSECSSLLLRFGGHQAAAGFKISFDKLQPFREQFTAIAARHFPKGPRAPRLALDVEAPLSALTIPVVLDLDKLEPYGNQNRQPLFLASGLKIVETPKCVGQGERHLRFKVKQESTSLWCIAFGMADRLPELMSQGGLCNLACRPQVNEWNGYRSVQLEVHDFQAGPQALLN